MFNHYIKFHSSGKNRKVPQVKTEPGETPGFILTDEDGSTYCALCGRDTLEKDAEEHLNKYHCDDPPRFYCNLCPKHYTVRSL